MSTMKSTLLGLLAVGAMLMVTNAVMAQAPGSPALHFSADYFSDTLGLADGTNVTGHNWVDNVAGAEATPFGIELTLFTNAAPGGNPVVRDNGAMNSGNNQWWLSDTEMAAKAPNLLSGTNDYTIIAIMQGIAPIPDVNNIGVLATWGTGPEQQNQWYLSADNGPDGYQRTFQSGASSFTHLSNFGINNADITSDFHAYGWRKSGGAAAVLENHTDGITSALTGGAVKADLGIHGNLGGFGRRMNFQHGAGGFRGDLAEIIFWDRALSDSELVLVDSYVAGKYAIPEPTAIALVAMGLTILGARRRRHC